MFFVTTISTLRSLVQEDMIALTQPYSASHNNSTSWMKAYVGILPTVALRVTSCEPAITCPEAMVGTLARIRRVSRSAVLQTLVLGDYIVPFGAYQGVVGSILAIVGAHTPLVFAVLRFGMLRKKVADHAVCYETGAATLVRSTKPPCLW